MDQSPQTTEPLGEEGRVLVLRWVQHTATLERHEVLRRREADERACE